MIGGTIFQFVFFLLGFQYEITQIVSLTYGREEVQSVFLVMIYSLSFASGVFWLHLWTIEETNIASYQNPPHETDDCAYCGKEAGIVCTNCDSVQWPRLSQRQGIATYLAHHRWRMLAAIISIGFVGPIAFHYTRYYDQVERKIEQHHEYEEDASILMSSALNIRSYIHTNSQNISSEKIEFKYDKFDLINEYYQLTWFASRVLDYLRCTKCNDIWRRNNNLHPLETSEAIIQNACEIIHHNAEALSSDDSEYLNAYNHAMNLTFMYSLDRSFIRYLNLIVDNDTKSPKLSTCCKQRVEFDLYSKLKVLACLISELTYNHNIDKVRNDPLLIDERKTGYIHKVYDCFDCLGSDEAVFKALNLEPNVDKDEPLGCKCDISYPLLDTLPWFNKPYELILTSQKHP